MLDASAANLDDICKAINEINEKLDKLMELVEAFERMGPMLASNPMFKALGLSL